MTPLYYLTAIRIESAKQLLTQGLSIETVAQQVGFESSTYFTAIFKKHTLLNPSEFKMRAARIAREKQANPFRFVPNCFAPHKGWVK